MSWWVDFLTVRIRFYPLQNILPTESRSADQLSVLEIILLDGHQVLQISEIFSVAAAQEIDVQSALSVQLPTKQATDPPGNLWIGCITGKKIFKIVYLVKRWTASGKVRVVRLDRNQDRHLVSNSQ